LGRKESGAILRQDRDADNSRIMSKKSVSITWQPFSLAQDGPFAEHRMVLLPGTFWHRMLLLPG